MFHGVLTSTSQIETLIWYQHSMLYNFEEHEGKDMAEPRIEPHIKFRISLENPWTSMSNWMYTDVCYNKRRIPKVCLKTWQHQCNVTTCRQEFIWSLNTVETSPVNKNASWPFTFQLRENATVWRTESCLARKSTIFHRQDLMQHKHYFCWGFIWSCGRAEGCCGSWSKWGVWWREILCW